MLTVHAERCVHQLAPLARCQACVDTCPPAAWTLSKEGLAFDPERCNGCGLCLPACPTQALQLPRAALRVQADAQGRAGVWLACERTPAPRGSSTPINRLPCVHAVDEAQLLQWHGAGVRRLSLATAECEACPSRPRQTLTQRLQTLNAALVARGAQGIALRFQAASETGAGATPTAPITPTTSATAGVAAAPPLPSRRAWLGLRSSAPRATPAAAPAPVGRVPALDRLRQIGTGPVLWGVHLDPRRCDGCCACARLCPTEAIAADGAQGRETALRMDLSRCVGCELCADVCLPGALSMAPALGCSSVPRSWPLAVLQCTSCGKNYRAGPAATPAGTARCPACLSLGVRHANRVVQAVAPAAQGPAEPSP